MRVRLFITGSDECIPVIPEVYTTAATRPKDISTSPDATPPKQRIRLSKDHTCRLSPLTHAGKNPNPVAGGSGALKYPCKAPLPSIIGLFHTGHRDSIAVPTLQTQWNETQWSEAQTT
jgi:hypothetical protein